MSAPLPIQTTEAAAELREGLVTYLDRRFSARPHQHTVAIVDVLLEPASPLAAHLASADTLRRDLAAENNLRELAEYHLEQARWVQDILYRRIAAFEVNLLDLAEMYGEACGALAEYRSAAVEWQVEQAEFNAFAAADRETVERMREELTASQVHAAELHRDNERLRWRHPTILPDWNDLPDAMRARMARAADGFDPDWGADLAVTMYLALREEMQKDPSDAPRT